MKRKYLIILYLIIFVLSILFIGCNSETTYTAEEWEEKQGADEKKEELYIQEAKDNEENTAITDYQNRLSELNNYINQTSSVMIKKMDDIWELD